MGECVAPSNCLMFKVCVRHSFKKKKRYVGECEASSRIQMQSGFGVPSACCGHDD